MLAVTDDALLEAWKVGPLEPHPTNKKMFTRVIGAFNFMFIVQDYKTRTRLTLAAVSSLRSIIPALAESGVLSADDADEAASLDAAVKALPELIGALATPDTQILLEQFCEIALADVGNGKFESLSEPHVGEIVFGTDITMQIPVAVSAARVNLGSIPMLMDMFSRLTAEGDK